MKLPGSQSTIGYVDNLPVARVSEKDIFNPEQELMTKFVVNELPGVAANICKRYPDGLKLPLAVPPDKIYTSYVDLLRDEIGFKWKFSFKTGKKTVSVPKGYEDRKRFPEMLAVKVCAKLEEFEDTYNKNLNFTEFIGEFTKRFNRPQISVTEHNDAPYVLPDKKTLEQCRGSRMLYEPTVHRRTPNDYEIPDGYYAVQVLDTVLFFPDRIRNPKADPPLPLLTWRQKLWQRFLTKLLYPCVSTMKRVSGFLVVNPTVSLWKTVKKVLSSR